MTGRLNLYGWTTGYQNGLDQLGASRGFTPTDFQPQFRCTARLTNPRHRCSHDSRPGAHPAWVDHPVWFRRGPARAPEQWALLAQPYNRPSLADVAGWANDAGAIEVAHLGQAPYGSGTVGLLIIGAVA